MNPMLATPRSTATGKANQRLGARARPIIATPKPVADRLMAALQASLKEPDVRKKLADLGAEIVPPDKQTPEGLRIWLKAEIDKWTPIIRAAGIYAD